MLRQLKSAFNGVGKSYDKTITIKERERGQRVNFKKLNLTNS